LCPAMIFASILAANMWKNSLKNADSDNSKILYETLLDFLQRNGTYSLNKPRRSLVELKVNTVLVYQHLFFVQQQREFVYNVT